MGRGEGDGKQRGRVGGDKRQPPRGRCRRGARGAGTDGVADRGGSARSISAVLSCAHLGGCADGRVATSALPPRAAAAELRSTLRPCSVATVPAPSHHRTFTPVTFIRFHVSIIPFLVLWFVFVCHISIIHPRLRHPLFSTTASAIPDYDISHSRLRQAASIILHYAEFARLRKSPKG